VEIRIEDNGAGIADTANLFVPFFTTKPDGSGIGLVLCQQIAENHGGTLDAPGPQGPARVHGPPAPAPLQGMRSGSTKGAFPKMGRPFPATELPGLFGARQLMFNMFTINIL
jgi:hypothetical protein